MAGFLAARASTDPPNGNLNPTRNNSVSKVVTARHKANRYDLGEVCLEVGVVLASLTLLTHRKIFWQLGCLAGLAGLAAAMTGFWVK